MPHLTQLGITLRVHKEMEQPRWPPLLTQLELMMPGLDDAVAGLLGRSIASLEHLRILTVDSSVHLHCCSSRYKHFRRSPS